MKHIKRFGERTDEMAMIKRVGKRAYVDERPMREVNVQEVDSNMLLYHVKADNFFAQKGKFWLWFVDDPEWGAKLNSGEYDMLMFPPRTRSNAFTVSPIIDVWKKRVRGGGHVLGLVEGTYDEDGSNEESGGKPAVYVEMMSVRPAYKHNHANTLMLDSIVKSFPGAQLLFVDPTDDGYAFMKKYGHGGRAVWTTSYRPKSWVADHPEDGSELRIRTAEDSRLSEE